MSDEPKTTRHGLTPDQEARARERASAMADVLAGWVCTERTLAARGLSFRDKIRASNELARLHDEAERLVNEVVA